MALRIELCPETGICSLIKDDGTKTDLMPGEVAELKDAGGDAETMRSVVSNADASFAAALDPEELGQIGSTVSK